MCISFSCKLRSFSSLGLKYNRSYPLIHVCVKYNVRSRFIQIPRGSQLCPESQPTQVPLPPSLPQRKPGTEPRLWNRRIWGFFQNHLHKANVSVVDFFLRFRALCYLSCGQHPRGPRLSSSAHSGGGLGCGAGGRGWACPRVGVAVGSRGWA